MTSYLQVWRANVPDGSVERLLALRPAAIAEAQRLCLDYVGAAGLRRPKVFKLTRRRLVPGRPATVTRRHRGHRYRRW